MDTNNSTLKSLRTRVIVNAVLTIVIGLLLILFPGAALGAVSVIAGVFIVASGVMDIWRYFSRDAYAYFVHGSLFLGVLKIVLGCFIFANAGAMATLFTYIFSVYLMIIGITGCENASILHRAGVSGSILNMIISILVTVSGIVLLFYPFDTALALFIYIGILMIVEGISELVALHRAKKLGKNVLRTMKEMSDDLHGNIIDM